MSFGQNECGEIVSNNGKVMTAEGVEPPEGHFIHFICSEQLQIP